MQEESTKLTRTSRIATFSTTLADCTQYRRLIPIFTVSIAAGAIALAAVSNAYADEPSSGSNSHLSVAPQEVIDEISGHELEDLEALADQKGISLDTAIIEYSWRDDFSFAAQAIREKFPDTFAGAEIKDMNDVRINFTGPAPDEALNILNEFERRFRSLEIATDVHTEANLSERDLKAAIEGAHYAVLEASEVRDASTSYVSEKRQVRVSVELGKAGTEEDIADLQDVASQGVDAAIGQPGIESITTRVTESSSPTLGRKHTSSSHYGGETLSDCTSGFGTLSPGGVRGIATAGHCSDAQSDDGYGLTFRSKHEGTHGDFQWHTGPMNHSNGFYAGSDTTNEANLRYVSSVGLPTTGLSLCRNGAVSNKDCQEVRRLHVCNGSYCNLVQMGQKLSTFGDSGGPYYWDQAAYGLHHGDMYDPSFPYDRDLFSRADEIGSALGVYIATN
ncbi:MAG: hypothetical protein ABR551_14110 [Gemmatimonadales bacterium]|nr:S1 family peptidase [Intrasporangiaceae bacterium]